eukprot:CAMPEP_0113895708 /NCGR_PEP_ID=MMETSP0780_2-20120614/17539_1 /TAXON_ID=652834 /ORGANISM="Palpitomonas bilix" /LENGTH=466 /DNA_ID=CAMNT_0000886621 /DNA_START=1506 /DNA_END=2906 /DNA_ORIENTATION=- /assembly_acc=CAM_ASM_000599
MASIIVCTAVFITLAAQVTSLKGMVVASSFVACMVVVGVLVASSTRFTEVGTTWSWLGGRGFAQSANGTDEESERASSSQIVRQSGDKRADSTTLQWSIIAVLTLAGLGAVMHAHPGRRNGEGTADCVQNTVRGEWMWEHGAKPANASDDRRTLLRWHVDAGIASQCSWELQDKEKALRMYDASPASRSDLPLFVAMGDSHARYVFLAAMRTLNGSNVTAHISFPRHQDFEIVTEGVRGVFLFRPFIDDIVGELEEAAALYTRKRWKKNLREGLYAPRQGNYSLSVMLGLAPPKEYEKNEIFELFPSPVFAYLSFSQWDLVYRRNDSRYFAMIERANSALRNLPANMHASIANGHQVFEPTLSEQKKSVLNTELVQKYRILNERVAGGVTNAFSFDTVALCEDIVVYSIDGVHMPLEYYNAEVQLLLNMWADWRAQQLAGKDVELKRGGIVAQIPLDSHCGDTVAR